MDVKPLTGGSSVYLTKKEELTDMIIKEDIESPARALRDVADDLAALNGAVGEIVVPAALGALTSAADAALTAATVATANATAPGVGYVQAEAASAATLANALKVAVNALIVDITALRTAYNLAQADVSTIRTKVNSVISALDDVDPLAGVTLKTTKG
jgi:hypothetical protein